MGRAGPQPRKLPKIGNKLFLVFWGEKKGGKKERKKKDSFGWEGCFHSQEELFKLANVTRPVECLPFISLLACLPFSSGQSEGKEGTDRCSWPVLLGCESTSKRFVTLQRHPGGNWDSLLGHEGLVVKLGSC